MNLQEISEWFDSQSQQGSKLTNLRTSAFDALKKRGLPNSKGQEEKFRFLNLKTFLKNTWQFQPVQLSATTKPNGQLLGVESETFLVFIDGIFQEKLSRTAPGVTAHSLQSALADGELTENQLATRKDFGDNPFAALNSIIFADGAFIKIDAQQTVTDPINVAFYSSIRAENTIIAPRLYVDVGAQAQATIIEQYVGETVSYATNTVTEIHLAENAKLEHYRLQRESKQAIHIGSTDVFHHGDGGHLDSMAVNFGAALSRHDLFANLNGSQLESTFNGIVLLSGSQISDTHSRIEHLQPNSQSNELYKSVLDGESRSIFNGRIFVDQKAQQTNAFQSNPNMLLTDDAVMNSNPELEIYADDVRCTHGATCGDLEHEALFYLRARGFDRAHAEEVLIYAFLSELIDNIGVDSLRKSINQEMFAKLAMARQSRAET